MKPETALSEAFPHMRETHIAGKVSRPRFRGGKSEANGCLHWIFEQMADAMPNAPALEIGERVLTYRQVDLLANQLARFLRAHGVRAGSFVGLSLERSEWPIVAILAVLKAGAAYVPIDPSLPDARMAYISETASFALTITNEIHAARIEAVCEGAVVSLEEFVRQSCTIPETRLSQADTGVKLSDVCYVLFTSGTTGRPKGVVTEHRNAFRFVHAFNEACDTSASDRVFQGFALGFDGSVEEMWMAFSNGAQLVCGDQTTPRFGEDLWRFLDEKQISFFSTVPTLLATLPGDLAYLRQLVVSGEACPPELVKRWATPERTMLNVYGPTEATVNTTASVLKPDTPVTIGRPLSGYEIYILDENLAPAETGELCISGPTLCRGYLNDIEQTERAFLHWTPPGQQGFPSLSIRLYRTGDLVRKNDAGELEFLGRIDSQVKIRGFRVELSEIDAVLVECDAIVTAATTVHNADGQQALASYIQLADGCDEIDRGAVLHVLRDRLPAYMVPNFLDVIEQFPRLASGKIDRKQLPAPKARLMAAAAESDGVELSDDERRIAEVWAKHLQIESVPPDQNFFTELGGHSLVAARVAGDVSTAFNKRVAVRDIYAQPTVRALAAMLETREPIEPASESGHEAPSGTADPVRARRPWYVVAIQSLYLLLVVPVLALPVIYIVPAALDAVKNGHSVAKLAVMAVLLALGIWAFLIAVAIAAKWLLIGRYKPGRYPLWGRFYICWWLVSRLQHLSNIAAFNGTPFAPLIWRAMGAKVGKYCQLNASLVYAWDCISLGDDVSIGLDTHVPALRFEGAHMIVGRVEIGDRCFIGNHASLGLDVRMSDDAKLDDQSSLPDGTIVPAGVSMRGSPPRESVVYVPEGEPARPSVAAQVFLGVTQILLGTVIVLVMLAPIVVSFGLMTMMFVHHSTALALAVFVGIVPVTMFVFALWAAAIKKAIHPHPKPKCFRRYTAAYLQYWLAHLVMGTLKLVGLPIFTTLYLPPWMRLLGAKLGRHTEMSTVWRIDPDMLEAGDGVFFADGCIVAEAKSHLGWVETRKVTIGDRSFVGNSANVSIGDHLGHDSLLGVLSTVPVPREQTPDQTDWLGSPGFQLPNRQKVAGFAEEQTYRPTWKLYLQRALIDGLRVVLPGYAYGAFAVTSVLILLWAYDWNGAWGVYSAATLLPWLALTWFVGLVVGLKWLIMGKFKPVVAPLWSPYVWWNEFINGLYESLMSFWVVNFYGTPFAPMLLRLLGCRIGRQCFLESHLFSEFDLVEIGDRVVLNAGVVVQNHLFEDRVMKSSYLTLSDGCTIGNMGVVLYDTVVGEDAVLESMSLLMKGETMPARARWQGIPTVSI